MNNNLAASFPYSSNNQSMNNAPINSLKKEDVSKSPEETTQHKLISIIQFVRKKRQFNLEAIFQLFKKQGLDPEINGDTILWMFQGKVHSLRLRNGCQLQITREYPFEPELGQQFECAAATTMNEVFSAKVGVRREAQNIFFSTEMLCSSIKEFGKLLPITVSILDAAEERQKENLREVIDNERNKPRRKIGYVQA